MQLARRVIAAFRRLFRMMPGQITMLILFILSFFFMLAIIGRIGVNLSGLVVIFLWAVLIIGGYLVALIFDIDVQCGICNDQDDGLLTH